MKYDSSNFGIELEFSKEINDSKFTLIKIDEIDFNYIYEKIISIDFNEIIKENNERESLKEEYLIISIRTYGYNMAFQINDPHYNSPERKLETLYQIILDIFEKVELLLSNNYENNNNGE
jgi:hypothetical protein